MQNDIDSLIEKVENMFLCQEFEMIDYRILDEVRNILIHIRGINA